MALPVITAVSNSPADGLRFAVTLAAPPTGSPTFYANHQPGLASTGVNSSDVTLSATGSGTSWTVTVLAVATRIRQGYYLAVHDDVGYSNEVAEWLCYGTNQDLLAQTEEALIDLIGDNPELISKSAQAYEGSATFPDGSALVIQSVVAGRPGQQSLDDYPAAAVRVHTAEEDLGLTSYTDILPIFATIYVYAWSQTRGRPLEPLVRALGMGIFNILNQRENLNITLDCGLTLKACHCTGITTDETAEQGGGGWETIAEIEWTAQLYLGK